MPALSRPFRSFPFLKGSCRTPLGPRTLAIWDCFFGSVLRACLSVCRNSAQGSTCNTLSTILEKFAKVALWNWLGSSLGWFMRPRLFLVKPKPLASWLRKVMSNCGGTRATMAFLAISERDGAGVGLLRGRIGSFADQVYPIYALSKFAQMYGATDALAGAKSCGDGICRVQGPMGQWWWHYDASTGRVAERYPVYSVHQEGMAPMALYALEEASGLDYGEAIQRGLRWISGNNELACDLREASGIVWRCIYHGSKHRVYLDRLLSLLGSGVNQSSPGGKRIRFECRPYELGWLLYALAGRQFATN